MKRPFYQCFGRARLPGDWGGWQAARGRSLLDRVGRMSCAQPGRRRGARAAPLVVSLVATTTGTNRGAHEAPAKDRVRMTITK
eukprot:4481499-Pleurochrysis_carterae.AAC.1